VTEETRTQDVVVERIMDAPAVRVWSMWTDPVHFAAWYGPPGATVTVLTMDVRVGGKRHVAMEVATPDGPHRMWLAGEHLEIVPHERFAYTEAMAGEDGTILDAGSIDLPDGMELITQIQVDLEDRGDRTRMVVTHVGVPADSPGADGWHEAMETFAATLATIESLS
jgi:uncharacterized protein YndB with AHSA1/START domain